MIGRGGEGSAESKGRLLHRAAVVLLALPVLALLAGQFELRRVRSFDPDEFQHAHSAFLILGGQLPYRDYFEHHPPLLHQLLARVMEGRQPGRDGRHALDTLVALRTFCWSFAILGALAHARLAWRLKGPLAGALASLLLWSTLIVFEKTIEIRPDTGAFAILQVAILLLSREASPGRTVLAFSLLGVGLLFTQKLIFPIAGLMAGVWFQTRPEARSRARERLALFVGLLWPTVLCAAYFFTHDALSAFIEDVFLINLRWKARLEAWPFFVSRFLEPNPFFAGLGAVGLLAGSRRASTIQCPEIRGERLVVLSAWTGLLGLALLPVAWEQYYLLFLPQLSILAAEALVRGTGSVLRRPDASSGPVAAAVLGLAALCLAPAGQALRQQWLRTDEAKERAIALVLDNSSPSDTVLDGYSGIGVFSPHAFRYFFLHAEMRQMLSAADVRDLEGGLESGVIAPRFVSGDSHLRAVSSFVRDFLDRNYHKVGDGPVAARLFPGGEAAWDDSRTRQLGEPPPVRGAYVLAAEGWSERQSSGGRSFRRSRGKASTVLFSVRDPAEMAALRLSARAGAGVSGLAAEISLNGVRVGEVALGPAFAAFVLPLPPGVLVRGFNRLEFTYPRRPAQADPRLSADENSTLALESLAVDRRQATPTSR
jgi:hypothetical protein